MTSLVRPVCLCPCIILLHVMLNFSRCIHGVIGLASCNASRHKANIGCLQNMMTTSDCHHRTSSAGLRFADDSQCMLSPAPVQVWIEHELLQMFQFEPISPLHQREIPPLSVRTGVGGLERIIRFQQGPVISPSIRKGRKSVLSPLYLQAFPSNSSKLSLMSHCPLDVMNIAASTLLQQKCLAMPSTVDCDLQGIFSCVDQFVGNLRRLVATISSAPLVAPQVWTLETSLVRCIGSNKQFVISTLILDMHSY